MQSPTILTRSLAQRLSRWGTWTGKCAALVLALGPGAACRPDMTSKVSCDQFDYIGPSFETTAGLGKFAGDLEGKGEMVRQVDEGLQGSLARWNLACEEFNAGVRGHDELRSETQRMRGLNASLWQMDHAADLAGYQQAFRKLHEALVKPTEGPPTPG